MVCLLRGFGEGWSQKTLDFDLCLRRNGFCDLFEGCDGLARAYTCERARGGMLACGGGRQVKTNNRLLRYTANPLYPRIFVSTI
jgi:hypothetical protein